MKYTVAKQIPLFEEEIGEDKITRLVQYKRE